MSSRCSTIDASKRVCVWPITIAAVSMMVAMALGQYALDANQNVYGSKINPNAPELKMGDEIYTVTSSGGMAYNRANAFRDNTYRIYQRTNIDMFRYDGMIGGSHPGDRSVGAAMYRREYAIRNNPPVLRRQQSTRPTTSTAPRRTSSNAIRPERYGRTLAQPQYSAMRSPTRTTQAGRQATKLPSNRVR